MCSPGRSRRSRPTGYAQTGIGVSLRLWRPFLSLIDAPAFLAPLTVPVIGR